VSITHAELAEASRCWLDDVPYRVALKEIGLPNGKRIDVLAYTRRDSVFRLVECKASLGDLKRIPKQLELYRRYADMLYVCVSEKLKKEALVRLPKNVGLLVVEEQGGSGRRWLSTRAVRNPRTVQMTPAARTGMKNRLMTWLSVHYQKSRICRNCMHEVPHGSS